MLRAFTFTALGLWLLVWPLRSLAADGRGALVSARSATTAQENGYEITRSQTSVPVPPGKVGRKTTDHESRVGKTDATRDKTYKADMTLGGFVNQCPTAEGIVDGDFDYALTATDARSNAGEPGPTRYLKFVSAKVKAHLNDDATIRELEMHTVYASDIDGVRTGPIVDHRRFRLGQAGEPDMDALIEAAVVTGDLAIAALMWNASTVYYSAQSGWLKPDACVEFVFDPPSDSRTLGPNESVQVRTMVRTKQGKNTIAKAHMDGGPLNQIGQLAPRTGDAGDDGNFTFTYTASANPKKGHGFEVGSTSRAGGAKGQWRIAEPEIVLAIDHHIAARRDTPKARVGTALFAGDVRFDAPLKPNPMWPGRLEAELSIVRSMTVGHVTPRCAGSAQQREGWQVRAILDQKTGMLELDIAVFPDGDSEGSWICDGWRAEVYVDVFSELGHGKPLSMPAATGTRRQFTIPNDGVDEILTVTVKAGIGAH